MTAMLLIDGQRAHSVDGLHCGFAERLAAHEDPVGCCDCGGPAPVGSVLTRIDRNQGVSGTLGLSAWRRCPDCAELRRRGLGALVRDALEVHGLGPAEQAPYAAIVTAMQMCGIPYWHATRPPREEFSLPRPGRWEFPAAAAWANGFRDRVRAEIGGRR